MNVKKVYIHPLPVRIWHWTNALGFVLMGSYMLWLVFYLFSDKIKNYHPELNPKKHFADSINQVIMLLVVPIQFLTGLLLWDVQRFAGTVAVLGGVRTVDTVHVLFFIFFARCTPTSQPSGTRRVRTSRPCSPATRKSSSTRKGRDDRVTTWCSPTSGCPAWTG